jgi:endonuclease/exonuclease/phosphatase family metal-dependent hydrolase
VNETGPPSWKQPRIRNKEINTVMRFGTWNVRTLLQAGNMNAIAEEAERYKMDAVALQEIRWKGTGAIRKSKFTIYYSGNDDRQGNRGVGFIVSKKVNRLVLGFSPICERICTLRIKGKLHNITFVNIYAPTEDTKDEIVDEFYETLQSVCDELPKHDVVITLGDIKAKLGKEQIYRDTTRRHCLHETTSNNGFRVAQYATTNNFKVLSTWYPRKDIHKGTWKIPGIEDTNQIDHILVSKRWATDIENIRTYRGANSDSDHFLVGARLKIAIITRNRIENRKRWNTDKLNETDVQCHYQQEVQQKLQGKPPSNDTEEKWTHIKEAIITSAQNVIAEKQNERNEEWYDQECQEMIKAKREARLNCIKRNTRANQEEYNRKRTAAATVCHRKKRETLKRKVDAIIEHHTKNESEKLYKRIQELTQEFKPSINVCRSEDGKILTENEDVQRRWKEYFESILTSKSYEIDSKTFYTAENEDKQPSYEEVTHVIQCLKKIRQQGQTK